MSKQNPVAAQVHRLRPVFIPIAVIACAMVAALVVLRALAF
ncbi:MAG: hypothetical protein GIKADHBN_02389 [Phycisphaerales bacterium]|nr:hypothetical protein [Phycisphaerales bacterium]